LFSPIFASQPKNRSGAYALIGINDVQSRAANAHCILEQTRAMPQCTPFL